MLLKLGNQSQFPNEMDVIREKKEAQCEPPRGSGLWPQSEQQ
jgi:hypothetical protein